MRGRPLVQHPATKAETLVGALGRGVRACTTGDAIRGPRSRRGLSGPVRCRGGGAIPEVDIAAVSTSAGSTSPANPAQHRLAAGGQLFQIEGLHQVVVGTKAQKIDPVGHGGSSRQHNDGHVPRPSGGYHLLARRPRQHEIGDQQIEAALPFQTP